MMEQVPNIISALGHRTTSRRSLPIIALKLKFLTFRTAFVKWPPMLACMWIHIVVALPFPMKWDFEYNSFVELDNEREPAGWLGIRSGYVLAKLERPRPTQTTGANARRRFAASTSTNSVVLDSDGYFGRCTDHEVDSRSGKHWLARYLQFLLVTSRRKECD